MTSRTPPTPPASGSAPRRLALAQLVNSVGDGAYYVCSVLYFTRVVGLSATEAGAGLTLGWAAGAVAGVPLGHLADRRGPRGAAVALAVATAAAVAVFLAVEDLPSFTAAAVLYACCQCGLGAARQALLAALVPERERTRVRAYLQSTGNAGLAVGAALGGLALHLDTPAAYRAVLAVDAAAFLAAALVLSRLPAVPAAPAGAAGAPRLAVLRDRPYALVTGLHSVLLLYMPLLSVVVPLWTVQRTEAPRWTVAALLALNTLAVVVLQVRVARGVTGLRSATRYVRLSGVLMLASCAAFALSSAPSSPWAALAVLTAAACAQVLGETLLAAGAWEISFGLAPEGRHGQYQGFFGTGTAVARMLGPLPLTWLVLGGGPAGWLALGAAFLASACAIAPAVRRAEAACPGGGLPAGGRTPGGGAADAAGPATAG
ncbi:MFS transporter [Streptomyces glaucosporus]|uniref:MFS transporter n=1 Tax=Streptomyces glaucosporus TaxID=284044 RepID=A0ABN3HXF4_9ACTN